MIKDVLCCCRALAIVSLWIGKSQHSRLQCCCDRPQMVKKWRGPFIILLTTCINAQKRRIQQRSRAYALRRSNCSEYKVEFCSPHYNLHNRPTGGPNRPKRPGPGPSLLPTGGIICQQSNADVNNSKWSEDNNLASFGMLFWLQQHPILAGVVLEKVYTRYYHEQPSPAAVKSLTLMELCEH